MARIAGINIPNEKRIEAALPYIYGVGLTLSKKILAATNVDPNKRTKDLTEVELNRIREYLEKTFKVEGELTAASFIKYQALKRNRRLSRHQAHSRAYP